MEIRVARVLHDALHVRVAPTSVDPQLDVIEPLHFAVESVDHELDLVVVFTEGVGHEVEGGPSIWMQRQPASRRARSSWFMALGHVPDDLALVFGIWRGMSRKSAMTCAQQQVPNLIGLRVFDCARRQSFG